MRIRHTKAEIVQCDMTPMIDMTFQLITFFMVVTNFDQTQADERVRLPSDQLAVPPDAPRENEVVLNFGFNRDKQGNKIQQEPFVFYGDASIPVLDYGPYFAAEKRLQVAKHGEEAVKDVTIVIRADVEVPTGLVQELIKLAQEAGFQKFSLKAMQSEEGEEEDT
jgi:biopolymer transport protein ExbD